MMAWASRTTGTRTVTASAACWPTAPRVEASSDGVLAIVITLLVLNLRAPEQRGAMLHELFQQWPAYVA
jgi:uncharacterized membrane protein